MGGQNEFEGLLSLLGSSSIYLQSGKFYDDLNQKIEDSREYRAYCDSLKNVPKGNAFRIYCGQLVKYLKTKYTTTNGQNNEYDVCPLLNYWIYGKLVDIYGSDKNSTFFQAYGKLQEIWSRVIPDDTDASSNNICKPIIFDIYKQDDWYERKEFYDYIVDYKILKDSANLYDSSNCEEYYKYIERKIPIYEHIKNLCTPESANTCPEFYKQCKECDPKKLLSELNCHLQMQEKNKAALEKGKATQGLVSHPNQEDASALTGRTGLPEYYKYIERKIPIYEHIKNLCTPESANTCPEFYKQCKECDPKKLLSELNCHLQMQEKNKAALEKGKATQGLVSHPNQEDASALTGRTGLPDPSQKSQVSSSAVTNASNAFLGVVVTSMTSGFLYKFTPLGTHLRNRFRYNRNAIGINRGDNGLFDYATESFNPYPGGEEHYIGYQPA
ncbi:PIR protein [Plasmodium vivax]|uniref:VIR protein n=2 Tax=Plasmodium vivax TaxID=5855 RepID=A0A565A4V8_PLAVI|nr:PIR protein [Plasmodium vivax]